MLSLNRLCFCVGAYRLYSILHVRSLLPLLQLLVAQPFLAEQARDNLQEQAKDMPNIVRLQTSRRHSVEDDIHEQCHQGSLLFNARLLVHSLCLWASTDPNTTHYVSYSSSQVNVAAAQVLYARFTALNGAHEA